jgi:3-oxoadipate enol-lactonase
MLTRQPVDGYVATCMAVRDADYTDSARRIAVPTLCAVGEHDGSTPPALVGSLAGLISGARFEVIRDAAHIPCIEQPDAVVALIRDFASALPEGGRS